MPKKHWTFLHRRLVSDHRIFRLNEDRYRLEPHGSEGDFVVLESPDWINVVPVTVDGRVVLIRQFRHGIRDVSLEVPGGIVDPGESPEDAARRELLEETGFSAGKIRLLGTVAANPAIQDNLCHCFLAEGVAKIAEPQPDSLECIDVVLEPVERIAPLIRAGVIRHSLMICSFAFMGLLAGPGPNNAPLAQ